MDQQNIDRLFREKLDDFEITPSPEAWSKVEKRISKRKRPAIYWIAASITLALISWFVWPESKTNEIGIASQEIDHPILSKAPQLGIPVAADLDQPKKSKVYDSNNQNRQIQMVASREIQVVKEVKNSNDILQETNGKTEVAMEKIEVPEKTVEEITKQPDIIEEKFSIVKITYIASTNANRVNKGITNKELKSDSTGVLKKFIALTEKLDPGEMLADIKSAKDDLISGGFKNKKDRSVLAP